MDDASSFSAEQLLAQVGWARALARRLVVDAARTDDVLQQAWIATRRQAARELRSPSNARGWLRGVIRNLASKQRRDEVRRESRERVVASREAQPSVSAVVAELEAQRLVVDALLQLDEPYRETLVRRWYRDEKPAAIAAAMAVPVKTVDTRLARGLERLRAGIVALRGGDASANPWALALIPLAVHAPPAGVAVVLGSLATGALSMSTVTKFAAALVAVAAVAWWGIGHGRDAQRGSATPDRSHADSAGVASGSARDRAAAPAAVRTEAGADPRPAGPRDKTTPTLHVRVIDVDGIDLRAAQLYLLQGEKVVGEGTIPEQSEPALPVPAEDANLLVESQDAPPVLVPVAAGTTALEVRLPRDHMLSGQLICEGRAPPESLRVTFAADPPRAGRSGSPAVTRSGGALVFGRTGHVDLATATDRDGRFRFTGLDAEASGTLAIPFGWSFEPISRDLEGRLRLVTTLPIAAPVEAKRIELFSPPAVVGRFVHADGSPVLAFTIGVRGEAASGNFSASIPESSHEQRDLGRFRVPLSDADVRTLDLDFLDAQADPVRHAGVHLDGPFEKTRDIGDVRVATAATVELDVVDAAGEPINDAIVQLHGAGPERRFVTSGRNLRISATFPFARVGAFGYAAREIELPKEGAKEPIEVVLTRTTELAVRIENPPQDESVSIDLELGFRGPLLGSTPEATLDWMGVCLRKVGGSMPHSYATDPSGESRVTFSDALRGARLFGLAAGVPFHVRLRGVTGFVLSDQEVTLAEAESRELVVHLDAAVRRFAGSVAEPDGAPVIQAEVRIQSLADPERGALSAMTGPDGRFSFTEFFEESVALQIIAPAHVTLRRAPFKLPPSEEEAKFELAKAWPLRVEVVDVAGHPVDATDVTARPADAADGSSAPPFQTGPDGAGVFTFVDLPSAAVRVRVDVGGARYEQAAAPPMGVVRFIVPQHGRVVLRYDLPLPESARRGRLLGAFELQPKSAAGATVATDATLFDPPRREGVVEFQYVLPGAYEIRFVWRDDEGRELEREASGESLEVTAGATCETTIRR